MENFCSHYSKVAITRGHRYALQSPEVQAKRDAAGGVEKNDTSVLFTRLACGQWSCPYCAKKMQKKWRAYLAEKLPEISSNWQMLTLTSKGSIREQLASYRALQRGIDVFMKRIRRVHGDIDYVRTFEAHKKDKTLHAHFIICGLQPFIVPGCWKNLQSGYLAVLSRQWRVGVWSLQTYLKNTAHECGLGYMAHVLPLPSYQAVNYVTKYLTKELQDVQIKGLRHVQTTRRIGAPDCDSQYRWQISDFVTSRDFLPGEKLIDLQRGTIVENGYFEALDIYPPEMN